MNQLAYWMLFTIFLNTAGVPISGGQLKPTSNFDPLPIETVALLGGSAYCEQIFESQAYICGAPCSGLANNTALITTVESQRYQTKGLLIYSKPLNTIFVSFRGTENLKQLEQFLKIRLAEPDWNANNLVAKIGINITEAKIHTGYEEIYLSVREKVQAHLVQAVTDNPNANIVFVGHSLGGALVTMAAVDYEVFIGLKSHISIYTFGTPRLGNKFWANFVDSLSFSNRNYRIVRRGDVVAEVPTQILGYEHSGQPFYFDSNGSTVVEECPVIPGTNESPICMNSAFPSIWAHFRTNSYFQLGTGC